MIDSSSPFMQRTLKNPIEYSGIGLFTGQHCSIRLVPSKAQSGIIFQRVDLPGKPEIPADVKYVSQTPRHTCLAKDEAQIQMVEHILSALKGMGIDNLRIEVEGPEIPSSDGSAKEFVQLIEQAGIAHLDCPKKVIRIQQPIYWSDGDTHLIALPSLEFRISYTLHYPNSPLIRSQYYTFSPIPQIYKTEIAPCRTFALYEEITLMIKKGLIKGGGFENALVIQGDRVLNPDGLRFPDEMVRHKVLDLMGDLSLMGADIEGHIFAIRSGHTSNVAFAKEILKSVS